MHALQAFLVNIRDVVQSHTSSLGKTTHHSQQQSWYDSTNENNINDTEWSIDLVSDLSAYSTLWIRLYKSTQPHGKEYIADR